MWSSSFSQGEVEEQVLISTLVIRDRTQRKGVKLSKGMFALDIRKMFFTQRVAGPWNWLLREVVTEPA